MTPERAQVLVATITSTLYESGNEPAPASSFYLALGCNMEEYETITAILQRAELAVVTSSTIKLTAKGMEVGKQCQEVLDKRRR